MKKLYLLITVILAQATCLVCSDNAKAKKSDNNFTSGKQNLKPAPNDGGGSGGGGGGGGTGG